MRTRYVGGARKYGWFTRVDGEAVILVWVSSYRNEVSGVATSDHANTDSLVALAHASREIVSSPAYFCKTGVGLKIVIWVTQYRILPNLQNLRMFEVPSCRKAKVATTL